MSWLLLAHFIFASTSSGADPVGFIDPRCKGEFDTIFESKYLVPTAERGKIDAVFKSFKKDPGYHACIIEYGCERRAHLMAMTLQQEGIESRKIFAIPAIPSEWVRVAVDDSETVTNRWNYHVAVLVRVREGDQVMKLVLDPSIFDAPVSVAAWSERLRKLSTPDAIGIVETEKYAMYPDDVDFQINEWLRDDVDRAKAWIGNPKQKFHTSASETQAALTLAEQEGRNRQLTNALMRRNGDFRDAIQNKWFKRWWNEEVTLDFRRKRNWFKVWRQQQELGRRTQVLLNDSPPFRLKMANEGFLNIWFSPEKGPRLWREWLPDEGGGI